jgi:hypothetical protein
MYPLDGVFPTGKENLQTQNLERSEREESTWGQLTLVMITTSSRGTLNCLRAFPRMTSDRPLEYALAVSKVLIPCRVCPHRRPLSVK